MKIKLRFMNASVALRSQNAQSHETRTTICLTNGQIVSNEDGHIYITLALTEF